MERKAIRVNVEVVYDDGTIEERAYSEPQVSPAGGSWRANTGWPSGVVVAGILEHAGDGSSWE